MSLGDKVRVLSNAYGKTQVRLGVVNPGGAQHEFIELSLDVLLTGDFEAAYTDGDNSRVVATDTMKNIAGVVARDGVVSAEAFIRRYAEFMLTTYPWVESATVHCTEPRWLRITVDDAPHHHAFTKGGGEHTCSVSIVRDTATTGNIVTMRSGFQGIEVLKTTGSSFSGFHRDQFRTLPDAADRILATSVTLDWPCAVTGDTHWPDVRARALGALYKAFANHDDSKSGQHTITVCAAAILDACPEIPELSFVLPNMHYILLDLGKFGRDNPNIVFTPISAPSGDLRATVARAVPA